MRSKPLTLLAAAAALAFGTAAQAQNLRELYEAARAYDASFLAAQAQARSAEFRAAQVDALKRPSAALVAATSSGYVDADGRPGGDTHALSTSLQGRYALFNRANDATLLQAEQSLALSRVELAAAEQDLIVRVAQAYFDVLAARDTLGTVRSSKAATAEQLASARRAFEVGTATITDTREAQSRYDLDVAREIAADNDLRAKRIALDQLVGRSDVDPRPLTLPAALPPVLPADPEAWVTTADAQHPTIQRAQAALEIARIEIERARAAKYAGKYPQGSPGSPTTTASIGLQFNLPLYTGGATANRIKETLALEDKSRNDLAAARRGVAQGTRVAYFGVQSGSAQVKALEAAEASSKLALEATQLGYRVGVRVNLDVLNAQSQLFQTQRELARARYDVLVGSLRLRQASGQLGAGDIDAVNALLAK